MIMIRKDRVMWKVMYKEGKREGRKEGERARQELQRGEHSPLKGKQSKAFQEKKILSERAGCKDL